jgi:hypothetical protein
MADQQVDLQFSIRSLDQLVSQAANPRAGIEHENLCAIQVVALNGDARRIPAVTGGRVSGRWD